MYLAVSLAAAITAIWLYHKRRTPQVSLPPGPPSNWWFDFGPDIPKQHPYRRFEQWIQQYGPIISFQQGLHTIVVIGRYDAAVQLMEREGAHLADRPTSIAAGQTLSGGMRTLLIGNGDRLRKLRKALHAQLRPVVAAEYQPIQQMNARHHILDILRDPENHMMHAQGYATSVILSLTYGKPTRTASDDPIVREVSGAQARLGAALIPGAYRVDAWPLLRYVPGYLSELRRHHDMELTLFRSQLDGVRDAMEAGNARPSFGKMILERQAEYGLSYDEVAYLAGSMFGAGSGTSSSAISIVIMAAALHPDAQTRVQAQLDIIVGANRVPTFEDESSLTEASAFYLESYRWRPVSAGGFAHRATKDLLWNDLIIPRGASVYGSHWSIARDPDVFPDPEKFDPQRWIVDGTLRDDLKVFQFGFGRRACPGSTVANKSLFINTALLLWAFRITQDASRPIDSMAFTNHANTHPLPFAVRFTPRRDVKEMRRMLEEVADSLLQ
ncbi:Cytochrome P450 [Mycena kentingensis (nom. inval.)]|nr:Cytochrome P450 [Mycena kentingensis (nom. inval.)]